MEDGSEEGSNGTSSTFSSSSAHGKTWSELKESLCEIRRQLSAISAIVPSAVSFRTLPDGTIRIFFLGTLANGWETTLHYAEIPGEDTRALGKLHWQQLLEFSFKSDPPVIGSSREELLLLERKRLTALGITSYELHAPSGKIVFPAGGSLYQCVDSPQRNGTLFPSELRTGTVGAKLTPEICPSNPDLVAYVSNCDIWLSHEASGTSERLTYAHRGTRNLADDPLSCGTPSYVIQEEFSRYEGFWWQPQSKDGIYRLLYEEVDDSEVKVYTFPSSTSLLFSEVEQYRFPRAGSPNSKSNLKMMELHVKDNELQRTRALETLHPLSHMFPWMEYVVRAGWTPDSDHVWVQLLDRKQQRLELILISLENFVEPPPNVFRFNDKQDEPLSPPVYVIGRQTSDVWINVSDSLHIFPGAESGKISYIWSTEETGFRHLHLVTAQLGSSHSNGVHENTDVRWRQVSSVPLTSGDWPVVDEGLWVDTVHSLVYFIGLKDSPLERHLYVVSLEAPEQIRLLTHTGSSYTVDINRDCTIVVATYSSVSSPPACIVFRIDHADSTVEGVTLTPIGHLVEPQAVPEQPIGFPEIYSHEISSGDVLYAMVFRPHSAVSSAKYPTVLNVYGGPEVQIVTNTFKDMRYLRMHLLASQGYCVVSIDSRGSYNRGVQFESHIKNRMGTVELDDQIEMLMWLSNEIGLIDMSRVAIFGWSYGGYLSLMGIAQYPDVFKVAVAGAPVTNWALYDTGYTERYMDLPNANPQGYKAGSILNYVNQFPNEEGRLLIVHGLVDDNVHFTHTSSLITQLVRKGKPYQLQVYPCERHSLRSLDASKHYETTLLNFLAKHL